MGTFWPVLLQLIWALQGSTAGNVGCLFNEDLCEQVTEWCFDDGAFGRCIDTEDLTPTSELYRHSLDEEDLGVLEAELQKLIERGYGWSHPHSQCILQGLLYDFQEGMPLDELECDHLKEPELEAALNLPSEEELAYIRFTPSAGDPQSDFADEVYIPHPGDEDIEAQEMGPPPRPSPFRQLYNSPSNFRSGVEVRDLIKAVPGEREIGKRNKIAGTYAALKSKLDNWPDESGEGTDGDDFNFDPIEFTKYIQSALRPSYFFRTVPTTNLVAGSKNRNIADNDDEIEYEVEKERVMVADDDSRGYTEGGNVFQSGEDSLPDLLEKLNGAFGFKRRERLDVKKPGPPYDPAFQDDSTKEGEVNKQQNKSNGQKEHINDFFLHALKSKDWPTKATEKKNIADVLSHPTDYEVIDTDYAYIQFKESIQSWNEGSRLLSSIAEIIHVSNNTFAPPKVDRNELVFKILMNNAGLNASEIAKRIDDYKSEIERKTGVTITATGIGYKHKWPQKMRLDGRSEHEVYVVGVVLVGVLAALALSAAVLYLTRKHGYKLKSHVKSEGEPMSKLYQDLCRARMSTKTPSEKETAPSQRITSLSKESDKDSPSSRSSTSSWSEEPALTNMDVATGQMVLSYMEEHLKNKEMLDTEWTALCAYEADPCATTIAQRAENLQKNRYPHALPYDHARVVLNELSNITGSDYINASTITDHDPRNAAYIVTQGPLPHTAPDLWQMVWEQGCVAMVMLTRLGEADSPLCYHYWPEEGSEMYHVYEVHLVSEHIWCDDYLVRSFYLKNLKTGETRTVTQFHFLSWPEGGVPGSTKPLLEFRRKVNKSFRGRSCPIVVHCSDGVGRSGSYVLLDMVLNRIAKGAKEIDVGATLEHIRDQRGGAVATKQQFQFILQAVADEVQAILKLLPQQP
ncbi:receptor-type tyrosine-protein phosphatase N2 isoform X2 [Halyomorpha halys]|uniref:receptor-type tyrosine-protein phosphatase N2 isoform X2 n=1 Tax=Halyomorpha halys TaxID=286706 RepID=UPI0006D5091D